MKCERKKCCDETLQVDELGPCNVGEVFQDEEGDVFMLCMDIYCGCALGLIFLCDDSGEVDVGKWYNLEQFCGAKCKRVCAKVVIS